MDLYAEFETDEKLQREGVDISIGDMVFKLKHVGASNKSYAKAFDKKTRQYRRGRTGEFVGLSEEDANKIHHELFADHIVVTWSGVKDRNGEELPFSRENCIRVFTDLPEFFLMIKNQAEDISHFKRTEMEDEAGN